MEPKGGAWAGKCNKKHGDGDDLIADLRGDGCRQSSGDLCVQGLIDGLEAADMGLDPEPAVRARVEQIPAACPDGLPFGETGLGLAPVDAVVRCIVVSVSVADGREATATPAQTTE